MPYEATSEWPAVWKEFHAWIDARAAAESPNNSRPCPLCGAECQLRFGRHKQAWRWHHPMSACPYARIDHKVWSTTSTAAIAAPMFTTDEIPNPQSPIPNFSTP